MYDCMYIEIYLMRVLLQPVVSFSEIVKNDFVAITASSRQYNRWTRVGFRSDPRAMKDIIGQHECHEEHNDSSNLEKGDKFKAHPESWTRNNFTCLWFFGVVLVSFFGFFLATFSGRGGRSWSRLLSRTRLNILHVRDKNWADSDAGEDAHYRRQNEHQTDHDTSEVDAGHAVHDDEDVLLGQVLEAVVNADGEHCHEELQIEIERAPAGRLVFADWGNDWDVVLGVWGVQQRVESAGPWGDF